MNEAVSEDITSVVLAVWEDIFNAHDLSAIDRLVAVDYKQNTQGVPGGRDGFRAAFGQYLEMSPDLRVECKGVVQVGEDLVVIKGQVFMDTPPPGYQSPIDVVDVFRVRDGMICEIGRAHV